MNATRLEQRFAAIKKSGRGGLVTFLTAGDPDGDTFQKILNGLPAAGADVIEVGMPFSDPVADGPAIQAAGLRALQAGMTLKKILQAVRDFRATDAATPLVLMGYYNPVYRYGAEKFAGDAADAGADGLIIVDLPPEEAAELREPAVKAGLHWVCLVTPTTDDARMKNILAHAGGFVYYVSIAGITGTHSAELQAVREAVTNIRRHTDLPVAVGFGIRTPEQAAAVTQAADAAVVGSALVETIAESLDSARGETVERVLRQVGELAGK